MVTVTCNNTECDAKGAPFLILGEPARVECGACHNDCEVTDLQPDPPQPEMIEPA